MVLGNSELQQCGQFRYAPPPSFHSLNQPGQSQSPPIHFSQIVDFHKACLVLGLPCRNPSCTSSPPGQVAVRIPGFIRIAGQLLDPIQAKVWHTSVPIELRYHLAEKIVQAIIPNPDPSTLRNNRMVEYALKVEGDIYQKADSRDEYYHLLAEEIYKIHQS